MPLSRKQSLQSAGALLLAGASALEAAPIRAARAADKTTLTIWWWGEQEAQGAQGWMNETIRLYEKANPTIAINAVLQTTNGLVPSFETAAKAHRGPDIQYLWGGSTPWARHGRAIWRRSAIISRPASSNII